MCNLHYKIGLVQVLLSWLKDCYSIPAEFGKDYLAAKNVKNFLK